MAYDSVRNEFVLFGGESTGYLSDSGGTWLNDTWTYNGSIWTQKTPTNTPPAMLGPNMAFDPVRGRMVLAGSGQLWEWDGSDWTSRATPFSGVVYVMAYDPGREGVVLDCVSSLPGTASAFSGATSGFIAGQLWNGTSLTQISWSPGLTLAGCSGVYEAANQRLVRFGGLNSDWTTVTVGNGWSLLNPTNRPSARARSRMVYDAQNSRALLYGGMQGSGELWSWNGTDWSQLQLPNAPRADTGRTFAINPANNLIVLFGGRQSDGTVHDEVWHLSPLALPANITTANSPGQCGATVTYSAPVYTGPPTTITCSPASGSVFPVGTTTVNCSTQTGVSGSFSVTVNDTEAPVLDVLAPLTLSTPGPAVATFNVTGADNCPGIQLSANPPSGSIFPPGTTTVTLTATDASNNTTQGSSTVTLPARYTITSNPPGLPVLIDGQVAASPATRDWVIGSTHTIGGVTTPNPSDGRTRFTASAQTITAQLNPTTFTVNFGTQHLLSTSAVPFVGGTVAANPPSPDGFYDAGTTVQLSRTIGGSFRFLGWRGGLSGTASPAALLMDGPKTVQAEFEPLGTCGYALSKDAVAVLPSGDIGRVEVHTAPGCAWTTSSSAPWITVQTGSGSGSGNGMVRFTVAVNDLPTQRTGRLRIAGNDFTVYQSSAGCSFTVAPPSQVVPHSESQQSLDVQTPSACQWTMVSGAPWLRIDSPSRYTVRDNFDLLPRVTAVGAGGQMVPVLQKTRQLTQWFADVPPSSPFFDFVALATARRLTAACQPGLFCPDTPLTRAEMAEFLIRGLYPSDEFAYPTTPYFTDVTALHPRFRFIQKLRELGITAGCSATQFCPNATTNRGEMAVFLTRARLGVTNAQSIPATPAPFFTDVPAAHPFFTAIQKLRELGITTGCSTTAYCPSDAVTKAQMSVFTVRALVVP